MNDKPSLPQPDVLSSLWVNSTYGGEAKALSESNARFDVLLNLMPQMVWSTRPDGYHDFYNERWYEYTGVPRGSTDGEAWNGMFHEADQALAWERWGRSLQTGEPYEIEYRLRHRSGNYRWVLGRALPVRDESGAITRWIGTCTDIHDAKMTAEQNAILSRELSHRIKNIFAVINGLIGQSARQHPESREFARLLQQRVAALGQAHEFARPHSEESRPEVGDATLLAMLRELLRAYPAASEGRLSVSGDDAPVDDRGATPIALVVHELATNSAKYGALSVPEGRVDVTSRLGDTHLTIEWRERGGPAIERAPDRQGFGTRLVELSVVNQLGGRIERDWAREGLTATIILEQRRLSR